MSTVVCYSSFHSFVTCFHSLLPVACFYLYLFRIFLFVFSLFHLLLFFLLSMWGGKMMGCFCRIRPHWVEVPLDVILLLFVYCCLVYFVSFCFLGPRGPLVEPSISPSFRPSTRNNFSWVHRWAVTLLSDLRDPSNHTFSESPRCQLSNFGRNFKYRDKYKDKYRDKYKDRDK